MILKTFKIYSDPQTIHHSLDFELLLKHWILAHIGLGRSNRLLLIIVDFCLSQGLFRFLLTVDHLESAHMA